MHVKWEKHALKFKRSQNFMILKNRYSTRKCTLHSVSLTHNCIHVHVHVSIFQYYKVITVLKFENLVRLYNARLYNARLYNARLYNARLYNARLYNVRHTLYNIYNGFKCSMINSTEYIRTMEEKRVITQAP